MKKSGFKIKRRQRKGSVSFNPDRTYVASAVEDFLNNGGKIEVLKADEESFKAALTRSEGSLDADEFLLGS